jgi:hypothetical protein
MCNVKRLTDILNSLVSLILFRFYCLKKFIHYVVKAIRLLLPYYESVWGKIFCWTYKERRKISSFIIRDVWLENRYNYLAKLRTSVFSRRRFEELFE